MVCLAIKTLPTSYSWIPLSLVAAHNVCNNFEKFFSHLVFEEVGWAMNNIGNLKKQCNTTFCFIMARFFLISVLSVAHVVA